MHITECLLCVLIVADRLRQEREAAQEAAAAATQQPMYETTPQNPSKRPMLMTTGRKQITFQDDSTTEKQPKHKEALEVMTEALASAANKRKSGAGDSPAASRGPSRKASFYMTAAALAEAMESPLPLTSGRGAPARRSSILNMMMPVTPVNASAASLPRLHRASSEGMEGDWPKL
jgi:hypothetical protein